MKSINLLSLILLSLIVNTTYAIAESKYSSSAHIIKLLDKSEAYYWAALSNDGYKRLFDKSRLYLTEAQSLISGNNTNNKALQQQATTLSEDLSTQEGIYANKFSTKYSLTNMIGAPLLLTGGVINSHYIFYSPVGGTIKNGIKEIIELLAAAEQKDSQIDVIILAPPEYQNLTGSLAHAFDGYSFFYTHTTRELQQILNTIQATTNNELPTANELNPENFQLISDQLSDRNILVISFNKMEADVGDEFFNVNGDIYIGGKKVHSISTSQFGFDRRYILDNLTLINLLMLLGAAIVAFIVFRFWNHNKSLTARAAIIASLYGFLIGRVASWLTLPAISKFSPPTDKAQFDSLPMLLFSIPSYLWMIAIGIAVFIFPILIPRLINHPLIKKYLYLPNISGKGAYYGIGVAHGIIAFIAFPLAINYDLTALSILFPVYLALLSGNYILGRSLLDEQDTFPEKYTGPVAVAFIALAYAVFGNSINAMLGYSIVTMMISFYLIYRFVSTQNDHLSSFVVDSSLIENTADIDQSKVEKITKYTVSPAYQRFGHYDDTYKEIVSILDGGASHIGLIGPKGSGKTVTARNLILDIHNEGATKGIPVLYFHGECKKYDSNSPEAPYDVIFQAIGSNLSLDLFGHRSQSDAVKNIIGSAGKLLLGPMGAFLSGGNDPDNAPSFSDEDILIFVSQKLEELSAKGILILHLDDLQWVDAKSRNLLKKLITHFNTQDKSNILFLLGAREEEGGREIIEALGINKKNIQTQQPLTEEQQYEVLKNSMHLSDNSASWIKKWISERSGEFIYPAMLIDTTDYLGRKDLLINAQGEFEFSSSFDHSAPPIPDGITSTVREIIEQYQDDYDIIALATYIGKEFESSTISEALGISRHAIIKRLDYLAETSGLFHDELGKDDIYAFRSQAFLDATREVIGYSSAGSEESFVPQSVRSFHAMIANALLKSDDNSPKNIFETAQHYYSAGKLYAKDSLKANLAAARLSRRLNQFENGQQFITRSLSAASMSARGTELVNIEGVLLACKKAHITGTNANQAADSGLQLIAGLSSMNEELMFNTTRALYEARRFDEAYTLAEKLSQSDNYKIKAEGHHFIALSLSPQDAEKRIANLQTALNIANENKDSLLIAAISNSLAEQLSYGSDEDKQLAHSLFIHSLEIKENQDIKDLAGMARTHGGLGRLAYFSSPRDKDSAKNHFEEDLKISIEINDQRGMSQMNSFLSQIDLQDENNASALTRSINILNIANNPFDVGMAIEVIYKAIGLTLPDSFSDRDQHPMHTSPIEHIPVILQAATNSPELLTPDTIKTLEEYLNQ